MSLRLLRRAVLCFAAPTAFVVSLPAVAHAQSISVYQEQSLPRVDADGELVSKRPIALKPEGVNYQDCVDDLRIRFPLQLQGFEGNASLEAWAGLGGADCKQQQNRSGINATCWKLGPNIGLTTNPTVDIPVRAIMAGAPPFRPAEPVADESVCGQIDLVTISVQFLYFSPGQLATPTMSKDLAVEVDTVGPAPPTGLRTLPGDGRITVQWDNISGEGGLSVLTGVRVYCDPAGGGASAEAGASAPEPVCEEVPNEPGPDGEDAGTSIVCEDAGGGGPATTCASPNLAPGGGVHIVPDAKFNAEYGCGSIAGNTGTSAVATTLRGKPLSNATTYAVAVAATDAFDNVGPLSDPICEYPEPTSNFWDNYAKAGGGAGGGLCNATGPGMPVGSMTALATIGIAAASVLRRRRNRR